MSTQQPEALRLADELDGTVKTGYWEAAAELRRLHSVNAELLEALEHARERLQGYEFHLNGDYSYIDLKINAAIAKATGQ
jgi:hypothetical protein